MNADIIVSLAKERGGGGQIGGWRAVEGEVGVRTPSVSNAYLPNKEAPEAP